PQVVRHYAIHIPKYPIRPLVYPQFAISDSFAGSWDDPGIAPDRRRFGGNGTRRPSGGSRLAEQVAFVRRCRRTGARPELAMSLSDLIEMSLSHLIERWNDGAVSMPSGERLGVASYPRSWPPEKSRARAAGGPRPSLSA